MTGRLIRKTPGRFVSLLAIVMLGTAFYIGVSAISKAMSTSVNRYDDMLNLKDITIYSNYGFDQADVDAVEAMDSVVKAEGASFVDVYSGYGDSSAITRVHSYSPDAEINQFVLRSGRLPEQKNEVLADNGTILMPGYALGTELTLSRPEGDLADSLSVDKVTVVGTIDTPLYLNETREASTLSNLYIQTFLYIPEEAFVPDYFTEMNVLIKDGKTYDEFSDEYRTYSASVKEEIKAFAATQKDKRPGRLKADAMKEYRKGRKEYEDGLAEFNKKISEAEEEIRNAEKKLADGWKEVRDGQNKLTEAQNELNRTREAYMAEINAGWEKLADGYRQLEEGKAQLEEKEEEYGALRKTLSDTLDQLNRPLIPESMTVADALQYLSEDQRAELNALLDMSDLDPSAVTAGDVLSYMRKYITPESVAAMDAQIEEALKDREEIIQIIEDTELPFDPEELMPSGGDRDPRQPEDPAESSDAEPAEPVTPEADITIVPESSDPGELPAENPDPEISESETEEPVLPDINNAEVSESLEEASADNGNMTEPSEEPETDTGSIPEVSGETDSDTSIPAEREPAEEAQPIPQRFESDTMSRPILLGEREGQTPETEPSVHIVTEQYKAPKTIGELIEVLQNENEVISFLADLIPDPQMEVSEAISLLHSYTDQLLEAEDYLDKAMHEPIPDELTIGQLTVLSDDVVQLKEQLKLTDETTIGEVRALLAKNIQEIDDGLAEGRKAIEDAEAELRNGEAELARGLAELEQGLAEGQAEINDGWNTISESIALLTDGRKTLNASILEFETQKAEGKQELDDAEAKLNDALADIEAMPEAEWTVLDRSQHYSSETYRGTINQMAAIARIFPAFFIAVAALVCLTTMTRLVNEERGQIGILRALGYRPGQCSFVYLSYAALAGLFGCVLGTAVGLATFPIIIYNTWKMLYILPKMQMEIPWALILTASFIFILMMTAVTGYVLHDDMKEVPSVIMRPKAPKVGKDILLEKVGLIWDRISFSWKVTIRNLARYKRRMAMTVLGVGGCTALLVTGFGISDSINNIVNIQFNEISRFDARVHLDMTGETPADADAVRADLLAQETTGAVIPVAEYSGIVSPDGETEEVATVEVFRDRSVMKDVYNLRERVGHEPLTSEDGKVIISEKMAENLALSVGDEIYLESQDGIRKPVTISGITEMYVYHYVMMTQNTYRKLYNAEPETNTLFLRLKDGIEADEEVKAAAAAVKGVESVDFVDFVIRNFETMIQGIDGVVIVLVAASMGLAFVVLGNLTNVNISERMREIATLKVLGFRRREVQNYIYHENNIMVALGALIGLPAGKLLSGYIMCEVELTNVMFGRGVEPMTYMYAFTLTLLFGMAVNLVMRKKLNTVKMVESLKSVE
ncbi:MAG: ABC transporter permease [Solobacterium sp.]|nr:ABC transporter permease [Solobacterium sp.]